MGGEGGVDEAVQSVRDAIQRKHLKAHPDIHLVLDATDSTRFAHCGGSDLPGASRDMGSRQVRRGLDRGTCCGLSRTSG